MARRVPSRFSAIASGTLRLVQDAFFTRLAVSSCRLWPNSRLPAVLLVAVLFGCLACAGLSARTVFSSLRPAATWPLGPATAAFLAFLAILELGAASVMTTLRGLLRLSYDTGRHRIGTVTTLLAAAVSIVALLALRAGVASIQVALLLYGGGLTLAVIALWFDRTYCRPAYPGFRDFHGDVVAARQHFARAAHVG